MPLLSPHSTFREGCRTFVCIFHTCHFIVSYAFFFCTTQKCHAGLRTRGTDSSSAFNAAQWIYDGYSNVDRCFAYILKLWRWLLNGFKRASHINDYVKQNNNKIHERKAKQRGIWIFLCKGFGSFFFRFGSFSFQDETMIHDESSHFCRSHKGILHRLKSQSLTIFPVVLFDTIHSNITQECFCSALALWLTYNSRW